MYNSISDDLSVQYDYDYLDDGTGGAFQRDSEGHQASIIRQLSVNGSSNSKPLSFGVKHLIARDGEYT